MNQLARPLLRWHGGKWRLAPWILRHMPAHEIYVEPFGGAGSVLLRKPPVRAEVWNDLDGALVNLFRVLRSDRAAELIRALALTPFARAEFEAAYAVSEDPVEEARRLVVRSFMGHGSTGGNRALTKTGFRKCTTRSHTIPATDWAAYPEALRAIVARLRGVIVENAPACDVIARYDNPEALLYLDPPYMPGTRSSKANKGGSRHHVYAHELTVAQHRELLDLVAGLRGMVLISGYHTPLYDAALAGWRRVSTLAQADSRQPRTEVLWINPRTAERLDGFPPLDRWHGARAQELA